MFVTTIKSDDFRLIQPVLSNFATVPKGETLMNRSRLGIGLVSAIFLLSVLVPFQTTHSQSDYVVDTERGTYYTTTTSKEQEGPTRYYVCQGCG